MPDRAADADGVLAGVHPFTAAASWDSTADVRIFAGETHQLQVFFRGCESSECPERWDGASPITRPEK